MTIKKEVLAPKYVDQVENQRQQHADYKARHPGKINRRVLAPVGYVTWQPSQGNMRLAQQNKGKPCKDQQNAGSQQEFSNF